MEIIDRRQYIENLSLWLSRQQLFFIIRTIIKACHVVVPVDQMISNTPGYIGHLRGTPTRDRYRVATIFVDHYSGIGYVYVQRSTSAKDTIEGKNLFEEWADTHGVTIKHYHADNGIFADNKFREAVK